MKYLLPFLLCCVQALAQVTATSPHQPRSTVLTNMSGIVDASGVLTNNGSGTFSYTGTTTGAGSSADLGKIPVYSGDAFTGYPLKANHFEAFYSSTPNSKGIYGSESIVWERANGTAYNHTTVCTSPTANREHTFPNSSGTLINTGYSMGAAASQVLTWNGTAWAPAAGEVTINTTVITGGTTTALLYDNGGTVGKLNIFLEGAAVLQMGADINGAATDQTIKAHDGITGANVSGASLTLSSGNSTGTGTSSVKIATPAAGSSGSTARTSATRMTVNSTGVQIQATTPPTSNPPAGAFILYVDPADNSLRARGSSGTITILATP